MTEHELVNTSQGGTHMLGRKLSFVVGALALTLSMTACADSTDLNGDAHVQVLLTDAPIDYIGSAMVDIGAVELIPADEGEGGPVLLSTDGTDGMVDLLELQNEATLVLAEADIPAGTYAQLRLIVEEASVTLAEGYEFEDGTTERDLFVPSGAQTGIKLNLTAGDGDEEDAPVEIVGGETILVLDFDVGQSFVLQGSPDTPAGIKGVLFTPSIRVVALDVAASISGTVTTSEAVAVEGLTVTAEPDGEGLLEAYQTTIATATTAEDGTYTIFFVIPGSYTVTVGTPEGFTTDPASVSLEVGERDVVTEVDFSIVPAG